ncbi:uncharacterized protein LOC111326003 [Stylophora pistillata]|uniref:uncharacterized protein LOC111326003 n=1 Tax=Stylophora pistillata TaxID=50429 RepID=UPI000C039BE2|nr:uncharacterized protein LOC111326003 [Stylophora pistillata]
MMNSGRCSLYGIFAVGGPRILSVGIHHGLAATFITEHYLYVGEKRGGQNLKPSDCYLWKRLLKTAVSPPLPMASFHFYSFIKLHVFGLMMFVVPLSSLKVVVSKPINLIYLFSCTSI